MTIYDTLHQLETENAQLKQSISTVYNYISIVEKNYAIHDDCIYYSNSYLKKLSSDKRKIFWRKWLLLDSAYYLRLRHNSAFREQEMVRKRWRFICLKEHWLRCIGPHYGHYFSHFGTIFGKEAAFVTGWSRYPNGLKRGTPLYSSKFDSDTIADCNKIFRITLNEILAEQAARRANI